MAKENSNIHNLPTVADLASSATASANRTKTGLEICGECQFLGRRVEKKNKKGI